MRWILWLFLVASLHAEPFGKPRTKVLGARTQLEFDDQTVIRLGANTGFEFRKGSREMLLENGTLLFSSPKGAGGGLIHTRSVIVTLSEGDVQMSRINDAVKVICMTGKATVASTANFRSKEGLRPGEMLNIPAGATSLPATTIINLPLMIKTSGLMKMGPLPSQETIERNARKQKGVAPAAPPRAESEAVAASGLATVQIENQQSIASQQLASQQAAIASAEASARQQQQLAAQQRSQQQAAQVAQQQADNLARQRAQQQAVAQQQQALAVQRLRAAQGNQGQGPQGNQGQGNQGNQGQGQGNNPPGQQPGGPPGQQ
jgi:FecR protein